MKINEDKFQATVWPEMGDTMIEVVLEAAKIANTRTKSVFVAWPQKDRVTRVLKNENPVTVLGRLRAN